MNWAEKLPAVVRGRASSMGESGMLWLKELDRVIARLEQQWEIAVTQVLEGGSAAFVGLAHTGAGEERILKISLPDGDEEEFLRGVNMLSLAKGVGYCTLYHFDAKCRAMLLERLGIPMRLSAMSPYEQMERIVSGLLLTWKLPKEGSGLLIGDSFRWFRDYIPESYAALKAPCSETVVERAMHCLDELEEKSDPENYAVIHGDAHNNNFLQIPGKDEYKFIDPDGVIFEKSYDLGVLMREWPEEYEREPVKKGRERSEFLFRLTGLPAEEIFRWGYLQMTATGLIELQIGEIELGQKMLSIAEHWAEVF